VGIQDHCVEAVILRDLGGDLDITLVAKVAAEFEVVEGEGVVRWFGPAEGLSVICTSYYREKVRVR
jgi:hypothetical protein